MTNLLLDAVSTSVDWARAQFALTAIYHWLFVPLTLGLAVIMGIVETCYYRTRKQFWKDAARFWQRLFGVNFAMGVATGIILEFEFGTNWSNYSWFVGDIFGAPLAIEGIVAFFMESTFVAVMFFGWKKVSPGFHLASTWLTGLGATISAWWILVANAWMQYPVGQTFNPDTMRFEMTSFAEVALSPVAVDKFLHTVTSSWIIGAVFTVGVSCWYLLRKREQKLAVESIKIGSVVGLVATLLAALTGDNSAYLVSRHQPMKLAAMEALYNGGNDQSLAAVAWVNPFEQPDYTNEKEPPLRLGIPKMLSFLATHDFNGYVPGVNDILKGYTSHEGVKVPGVEEKMAMGRRAMKALKEYRELKVGDNNKNSATLASITTSEKQQRIDSLRKELTATMPYYGYGFVKSPHDIVPNIPLNFWCFRIMVGMGCLFILFFLLTSHLSFRSKNIDKFPWIHRIALLLIPLAYIASESGWVVAELGRQPWTIQDMLPTWAAISNVQSGSVALTFFVFLALFTTMLVVEINILCKQIKKGPEHTQVLSPSATN